MLRVHFLGIGGSGMSAVAQIAHAYGYQVSGCDKNPDTPYIAKVKAAGIKIYPSHDPSHIENIDLLAITPAALFQTNPDPELAAGQKKGIVMKWQQFLGEHLHQGKKLICIAGTHGKSTTTALAGQLLIDAKLDPTVEVGATVKIWENNVRIGQGDWFISEADEYHDNFASYHPDILILNNIEMDHPEYFKTQDNLLAHFQRLIDRSKQIIFNTDSPLIHQLKLPASAIAYSSSEFPTDIALSIPGTHNKANAMGIIKLASLLSIPSPTIKQTLQNFNGLHRRIELIGESPQGIRVYDDYANHPTAFSATLSGVKELNPHSKIFAIIEPHTFSRLRAVLADLPASITQADEIIVSKIYASRETDPGDFSGQDIVTAMHHPHAQYIPEFTNIVSYITSHAKSNDTILVMGSGNSYKLAQDILASLAHPR